MVPIANNPEAAARLQSLIAFGFDELWAREIVAIEFGLSQCDKVMAPDWVTVVLGSE